MDAFQIRIEFLGLLRRLTASQQSIAKLVDYAIRYATIASDDIWDCIVSECTKTTLNARLNILFLLDALLLHIVDPIGFSSSSASGSTISSSSSSSLSTANLAQAAMAYLGLATRDLQKIILQCVVPGDNWDAVRLNASSTEKVLASWKRLNIFEHVVLDELVAQLQVRKTDLSKLPSSVRTEFSKQDVLRRMEEDRERQKRLRERAWILPAKSFYDSMPVVKPSTASGLKAHTTNTPVTASIDQRAKERLATDALEVEFEHVWDNLSDLNEDDLDKIREDDVDWWGSKREVHKEEQITPKDSEIHMYPSKKRKAEESEVDYQHHLSDSQERHSHNTQSQQPNYRPPSRPGPPPDPRMYVRPSRWSLQGGT